MVTWIDIVRPFKHILPRVETPSKKQNIYKKILYVFFVLLFYLIGSKMPLYGIRLSNTDDPLSFYRVMLASNRGTLMELGISPIVTSNMILQVCTGAKIIKVDRNNPEQNELYGILENLIGLCTIFAQTFFYTLLSGQYGSIDDLGFGNILLIIFQLVFSGIFVLLLDELSNKGYGFGSAISLFISVNTCENMMWQAFSYRVVQTMSGPQYEGAITFWVSTLLKCPGSLSAWKVAFFRTQLPNVLNLLSTIIVFSIVIFFQGFRVDIPIRDIKMRLGQSQNTYPIRLFYTSNVPIMLQSALTSTIFMFSSLTFNALGQNALTSFIGTWKQIPTGHNIPVSGLVYYISAPKSFQDIFIDPIHAIIYVLFVLLSCSFLSVFHNNY